MIHLGHIPSGVARAGISRGGLCRLAIGAGIRELLPPGPVNYRGRRLGPENILSARPRGPRIGHALGLGADAESAWTEEVALGMWLAEWFGQNAGLGTHAALVATAALASLADLSGGGHLGLIRRRDSAGVHFGAVAQDRFEGAWVFSWPIPRPAGAAPAESQEATAPARQLPPPTPLLPRLLQLC